jgi:hypothetical protein
MTVPKVVPVGAAKPARAGFSFPAQLELRYVKSDWPAWRLKRSTSESRSL